MPVKISIIILSAALLVILITIIRKFPVLAILDVENIPGEKEARFKKKIITQRVERDLAHWEGFFGRLWLHFIKYLSSLLHARQEDLRKTKIGIRAAGRLPWPERQRRIKELATSADDLLKKEDFPAAEQKLVEIISLDTHNLDAFFRLGGLYESQRRWPEARETYEYCLKLLRQHKHDEEIVGDLTPQEVFFALAETARGAENLESALENAAEALELEPNNPRYLDLILDLSIMKKDKELATVFWEKLAAANPENQKLSEWREKIDRLED